MKTFLDSGVLITAWKGKNAEIALSVLEEPARSFYSSYLVRMEVLPKPAFERKNPEIEFYNLHWERLEAEEPLSERLSQEAMALAKQYGLAAVDALHIAAAIRQGVEEFITTESPGKPLFRVKDLTVTSLQNLSAR
jgi:predicted nucleic acid-binding protein